jgi:hypothetical protein
MSSALVSRMGPFSNLRKALMPGMLAPEGLQTLAGGTGQCQRCRSSRGLVYCQFSQGDDALLDLLSHRGRVGVT